MRNNTRQNHMIDFLFPVTLFFVFTICAVVVILLATQIYQTTMEDSILNDTSRTSLSYVNEKIHQNDCHSQISLGTMDGCDSLIIDHCDELEGYHTYIYVYENQLKELFTKEGATLSASVGKTIMQVNDFCMETIDNGLLRISCTNAKGDTVSTFIGIRSTDERKD